MDGSHWIQSLLAWHLPDTEENRIRLRITPQSQTVPSKEGIEILKNSYKYCVPNVIARVPLLLIAKP